MKRFGWKRNRQQPNAAATGENEDAVSPAAPVADHSTDAAPPTETPSAITDVDAAIAQEPAEREKKGWFSRLKSGLSRSTGALSDGVSGIFTKARLDRERLDELEDVLIQADLGVDVAMEITDALASERFDKEISPQEVREFLADHIAEILTPVAAPLNIERGRDAPFVILVVGVNGTGKTTTIGKLGNWLQGEGYKVMLGAGDTFRAAAIEQLQVWGERLNVPVIAREPGADAAGLAYDALEKACEAQADVLLIDTAGRLQNKAGLMDELRKIKRVLGKLDVEAPHAVLLVLDATTGQNAISQVEVFQEVAGITGLVMTKLDGTARGGILVAVARRFGLPIHAIGIGEGIEDLRPFDARQFAQALTGATAEE